jgi:hypothetical protein
MTTPATCVHPTVALDVVLVSPGSRDSGGILASPIQEITWWDGKAADTEVGMCQVCGSAVARVHVGVDGARWSTRWSTLHQPAAATSPAAAHDRVAELARAYRAGDRTTAALKQIEADGQPALANALLLEWVHDGDPDAARPYRDLVDRFLAGS